MAEASDVGGPAHVSVEDITAALTSALAPDHLTVVDTSAQHCGSAFEVVAVSEAFEGETLLKRHRKVLAAVDAFMPRIHAFSQVRH